MAKKNNDAELLAIWLHSAARSAGHLDLLRGVVHRAAQEAAEMYGVPGDDQLAEDDDAYGVKEAIGKFACKWDECERIAREDEASGPGT